MVALLQYLDKFLEALTGYLPGIIGAILLIVVGYFISRAIKKIIVKLLERMGFDGLCDRIKLTQALNKVGIKSVSSLIGTLVFWALFILFLGWGFELINVPELVPILSAISSVMARVLVAVVIVIVGIAIADFVLRLIKKALEKIGIQEYLAPVDKTIEKTGVTFLDFLYYAIEALIVLFFVQGAFQVLNVEILSRFIEPILLYVPRVITAIFVLMIGFIISEAIVRLVNGILNAINFSSIVKVVEDPMKREGIIIKVIDLVLRVFIMIVFIELALDILGIPLLIAFLNAVLFWLPSLVAAIIIVVAAWWLGAWVGEKVNGWCEKNEIPYNNIISAGIKYGIMAIGLLIALDQIGIEVYVLNAIISIIIIALVIPVGVALAFGFKDYGSDIGVGMKLKRIAKEGDRIEGEGIKGDIVEVGSFATTIKSVEGEVVVPNTTLRTAKVIKKRR